MYESLLSIASAVRCVPPRKSSIMNDASKVGNDAWCDTQAEMHVCAI